MAVKIKWFSHASFKISTNGQKIYIDPWKLKNTNKDADIILISHSHYDHLSPEDIDKISKSVTTIIASMDTVEQLGTGVGLLPGQSHEFAGIKVQATPAYNPEKKFHPKANNWIGFIIEVNDTRIYYAGDTDIIPEMEELENIDVSLLPVGGTYTMNPNQAAEACKIIGCKHTIPYHWGDIIGGLSDAIRFTKAVCCNGIILHPGEETEI